MFSEHQITLPKNLPEEDKIKFNVKGYRLTTVANEWNIQMIYGLMDSKAISRSYIYKVNSEGAQEKKPEKMQPEFPSLSYSSEVLSEINF